MKKISILLALLLLSQFAWCQYRITIDRSNTYKSGLSYLIDIPYNGNIKNLYVDNRTGIIPVEVLISARNRIWNNIDTLIVLGKNNLVKDTAEKNGTNKDEFDEHVIPRYREVNTLKGVSIKLLKYNELTINAGNDQDSLLIYYSEEYGSSCCPEDPKYKIKPSLEESIKQFEDTYKVKIGKTYSKHNGKEGEHIVFFTLDELNPIQKIEFITQRLYDLIPNKKNKDMIPASHIYMPFLVSKKYLNVDNYIH